LTFYAWSRIIFFNQETALFSGLFYFLSFFLGWRKHSFIFFWVGLCVGKKNESVFCAVEWVDFFYKFIFETLALEAVSVVVCFGKKMPVQSQSV